MIQGLIPGTCRHCHNVHSVHFPYKPIINPQSEKPSSGPRIDFKAVFLNHQSADQHQPKELLLPKKSSFLKLLGKCNSKDRKSSEQERTTIMPIMFSFYNSYYYVFLTQDYVTVFKHNFLRCTFYFSQENKKNK
jgi:hypothetical protein